MESVSLPSDLVAWVTVDFLHILDSKDVSNMAILGNSTGFLLQRFDILHGIERHPDTLTATTSGSRSLKTEPVWCPPFHSNETYSPVQTVWPWTLPNNPRPSQRQTINPSTSTVMLLRAREAVSHIVKWAGHGLHPWFPIIPPKISP